MPVASTASNPAGGPAHFSQLATAMGAPPLASGSWASLHTQTMRLPPGGWSHPGSAFLRLTVPLSRPGRVRRRIAGHGRAWMPGVKRMGTVSVTPPGTEGEWEWMDPSHFGLLFVPEALLREALDEAGEACREIALRPAYAEPDELVRPVFDAIQQEIERAGRSSQMLVSSAALFLTRHVLHSYAGQARAEPPAAALGSVSLRRVIDAVEARLGHDWSVQEMAREAGLSPFWFAHAFRAKLGVSPRRFVQQRRLARARILLHDRSRSIADIAAQCGFESQSWFTTSFRAAFGVTPAVYRRQVRA